MLSTNLIQNTKNTLMNRILVSFVALLLFAAMACNNNKTTELKQVKEVKAYFNDSISPRIVWEYPEGDSSIISVTHFYKNGKMRMQGNISGGVRVGKWIAWDDRGKMLSAGNYIDGIENGDWTVWYPSGQVRYEGVFKDGNRVGVWKFYDEQGVQLKEIEY